MATAKQHEVPNGVGTVADPVANVVAITPRRGTNTPREPAVTVPHDHRPAHRRGHDRGPASPTQGLAATLDPHPADPGTTGPPPKHLRPDPPDVIKHRHR